MGTSGSVHYKSTLSGGKTNMTVFLSEYIHPNARKALEEHCTVVDTFDNPDAIDAIISARTRWMRR